LGFKHSEESLAKMSCLVQITLCLVNPHAAGSKVLMSIAKGGSLVNTFSSAREAAKEFNTNHQRIMRYVKNGKLFRNEWILTCF
jgi:hypothetical protein